MTLEEVVAVFRKWLHLPDPEPLYAVLGTVAANRLLGDPVWLLLVGGSSWGKSEHLASVVGLPGVYPAATFTEAALLSGTPRREVHKDAKGGLLRLIGDSGIIVCKDFGSVLNMNRDARASLLAALREVYDGSWTRHVGSDGGRTLHWEGKVGFLGGCTGTIDRHHAVMSSLGERFVFFRLLERDDEVLAHKALDHAGKEHAMRPELSMAVRAFFDSLDFGLEPSGLNAEEKARLVALTTFVVRCRSTVERDAYSRDIELVPGAEAPGRLTRVLARLQVGLQVIGLPRPAAWRLIQRVGLDSMPAVRRQVLAVLAATDLPMTTAQVAARCGYPSSTGKRQLEELAAYGVLERHPGWRRNADGWSVSAWARDRLAAIGAFPGMSGDGKAPTAPEMSGGSRGAALPEMSGDASGEGSSSHSPITPSTDISGKIPLPQDDADPDGQLQLPGECLSDSPSWGDL